MKPAARAARSRKLPPAQQIFCLEYLANGFNATQAYLRAHPGVKLTTAAAEGYKALRNPEIAAWLLPRLEATWKALEMAGEEALALVALDARADLRDLFDEKGELLKPHEWPGAIAASVRGIQPTPFGWKVLLNDKLAARRIILEQTGKLRTVADGVDALAAAIRADQEKHGRHE